MPSLEPSTAEEAAETLRTHAAARRTINIGGNGSKHAVGGPIIAADVHVTSVRLNRVLAYEPNDLTAGVEAGVRWADLQAQLAANRQMIALDPPYARNSTVGGLVGANLSGPLRRGYGTLRDLIIGMEFATVEGKIVKAGGMVVKNVAGLDIAKLMIGSFGTLAFITRVNFRLHPLPPETLTFVLEFADLDSAIARRNTILNSLLQPLAIDILTPAAAVRVKRSGFVLAIRAAGSPAVLNRYRQDLAQAAVLQAEAEISFWNSLREFTPDFLSRQPGGAVLRITTPIADVSALLRLVSGPAICRAGSGVTYVYVSAMQNIAPFRAAALDRGWHFVVEAAAPGTVSDDHLWSAAEDSGALAIMKRVKQAFDPDHLLNRSRLYGRI